MDSNPRGIGIRVDPAAVLFRQNNFVTRSEDDRMQALTRAQQETFEKFKD